MTRQIDPALTAARLDELNRLTKELGHAVFYRLAGPGWCHEVYTSGPPNAFRTKHLPDRIERRKAELATRSLVESMKRRTVPT